MVCLKYTPEAQGLYAYGLKVYISGKLRMHMVYVVNMYIAPLCTYCVGVSPKQLKPDIQWHLYIYIIAYHI